MMMMIFKNRYYQSSSSFIVFFGYRDTGRVSRRNNRNAPTINPGDLIQGQYNCDLLTTTLDSNSTPTAGDYILHPNGPGITVRVGDDDEHTFAVTVFVIHLWKIVNRLVTIFLKPQQEQPRALPK